VYLGPNDGKGEPLMQHSCARALLIVPRPHKIRVLTLAPIYHMGILGRVFKVVIFVSLNKLPHTEPLSWYQLKYFRTMISANSVPIYRKWSGIFETVHSTIPTFALQERLFT
jgi:hypothetical protein